MVDYVAPSGAADEPSRQRRWLQRPARADELGSWQAFAAWAGDATSSPAVSTTCAFSIGRTPTAVSVNCTASADKKTISCQGQLVGNGAGLAGRPLTVTYENTDTGSSTPHSVQTGADGSYSDSLAAPPGALLLGHWQLTAQFAGETSYAPSSASQSLTVSVPFALPVLFAPG